MFKALFLEKTDAAPAVSVKNLNESDLPDGDVLVAPEWSTLNYKDALAITGKGPVVRRWPMVPGIDGSGVVIESLHPKWKKGDAFVLNGFGVGETHWGCLAERARLNGDWLVPLPKKFSARQAMAIGTAGYTAMLCVLASEDFGVRPGDGEVLVTGATGGVGSIAMLLLSKLGYTVVGATGKTGEHDYLKSLGAASVIDRRTLSEPGKPLQKERCAAAIDVAGGHTLANVCAQTKYRGIVTACGLAQSGDFPASVMPFILRGIILHGIDSAMAPLKTRERAWDRLVQDLDIQKLDLITQQITLAEATEAAAKLMQGQSRGRVVVKI